MTEELFRNDAYIKHCSATVTGITDRGVILDQTVFYPEGGGQPGDRGRLHDADGAVIEIVDTIKTDAGIEHLVAEPAALSSCEIGEPVRAEIDWDYRYRHMRMHTCLHLLCALLPYDVTGGSLNQEKGRLDFDMNETVDKANLETELNDLISRNASVSCRWISDEDMSNNMELVRTMSVKPPMGQGQVRLVDVNGIDLQPCGGTHVANTQEIGAVRLGKVEKKGKQNRRINLHLID